MYDDVDDTDTATSIQFSVASSNAISPAPTSFIQNRDKTASSRLTSPPALSHSRPQPSPSLQRPVSVSPPTSTAHALKDASPPPTHGQTTLATSPPPLTPAVLATWRHSGNENSHHHHHTSRGTSHSDASMLFVQAVTQLDTPHLRPMTVPRTALAENSEEDDEEDEEDRKKEAANGGQSTVPVRPFIKEAVAPPPPQRVLASATTTSSRGSIDFEELDGSLHSQTREVTSVDQRSVAHFATTNPSAAPQPPPAAAAAAPARQPPAVLHMGNKVLVRVSGPAAPGSAVLSPEKLQRSTGLRSLSPPSGTQPSPTSTSGYLLRGPPQPQQQGSQQAVRMEPAPRQPSPGIIMPTPRPTIPGKAYAGKGGGGGGPRSGLSLDVLQRPSEGGLANQQHFRTQSITSPVTPRASQLAVMAGRGAGAGGPLGISLGFNPHGRVSSVSIGAEDDPVYCTVSEMTNAASMRAGGTHSLLPGTGGMMGGMGHHRRPSLAPSPPGQRTQSFDNSFDESNALLTANTPREGSALVGSGRAAGSGSLGRNGAYGSAAAVASLTPPPTPLPVDGESPTPPPLEVLNLSLREEDLAPSAALIMPLPVFNRPGSAAGLREGTLPPPKPRQQGLALHTKTTPRTESGESASVNTSAQGTYGSPLATTQTAAGATPLLPRGRRTAVGEEDIYERGKRSFTVPVGPATRSSATDNRSSAAGVLATSSGNHSTTSRHSHRSASQSIATVFSKITSQVRRGAKRVLSARSSARKNNSTAAAEEGQEDDDEPQQRQQLARTETVGDSITVHTMMTTVTTLADCDLPPPLPTSASLRRSSPAPSPQQQQRGRGGAVIGSPGGRTGWSSSADGSIDLHTEDGEEAQLVYHSLHSNTTSPPPSLPLQHTTGLPRWPAPQQQQQQRSKRPSTSSIHMEEYQDSLRSEQPKREQMAAGTTVELMVGGTPPSMEKHREEEDVVLAGVKRHHQASSSNPPSRSSSSAPRSPNLQRREADILPRDNPRRQREGEESNLEAGTASAAVTVAVPQKRTRVDLIHVPPVNARAVSEEGDDQEHYRHREYGQEAYEDTEHEEDEEEERARQRRSSPLGPTTLRRGRPREGQASGPAPVLRPCEGAGGSFSPPFHRRGTPPRRSHHHHDRGNATEEEEEDGGWVLQQHQSHDLSPEAILERRRTLLAQSRVSAGVDHFDLAWRARREREHRSIAEQSAEARKRVQLLLKEEKARRRRSQPVEVQAAVEAAANRCASQAGSGTRSATSRQRTRSPGENNARGLEAQEDSILQELAELTDKMQSKQQQRQRVPRPMSKASPDASGTSPRRSSVREATRSMEKESPAVLPPRVARSLADPTSRAAKSLVVPSYVDGLRRRSGLVLPHDDQYRHIASKSGVVTNVPAPMDVDARNRTLLEPSAAPIWALSGNPPHDQPEMSGSRDLETLQRRYEDLLEEIEAHARHDLNRHAAARFSPSSEPHGAVNATASSVGQHTNPSPQQQRPVQTLKDVTARSLSAFPMHLANSTNAPVAGKRMSAADTDSCATALRMQYYHRTAVSARAATAASSRVADQTEGLTLPVEVDLLTQLKDSYVQALHPSCTVCRPQHVDEYLTLGLLSLLHGNPIFEEIARAEGVELLNVNGSVAKSDASPALLRRKPREELYAAPTTKQRRRAEQSCQKRSLHTELNGAAAARPPFAVKGGVAAAAVDVVHPYPVTVDPTSVLALLQYRTQDGEAEERLLIAAAEKEAVQALRRHYIVETICVLRQLRTRELAEAQARAEEKRMAEQQAPRRLKASPELHLSSTSLSASLKAMASVNHHHLLAGLAGHEPVTPALAGAAFPIEESPFSMTDGGAALHAPDDVASPFAIGCSNSAFLASLGAERDDDDEEGGHHGEEELDQIQSRVSHTGSYRSCSSRCSASPPFNESPEATSTPPAAVSADGDNEDDEVHHAASSSSSSLTDLVTQELSINGSSRGRGDDGDPEGRRASPALSSLEGISSSSPVTRRVSSQPGDQGQGQAEADQRSSSPLRVQPAASPIAYSDSQYETPEQGIVVTPHPFASSRSSSAVPTSTSVSQGSAKFSSDSSTSLLRSAGPPHREDPAQLSKDEAAGGPASEAEAVLSEDSTSSTPMFEVESDADSEVAMEVHAAEEQAENAEEAVAPVDAVEPKEAEAEEEELQTNAEPEERRQPSNAIPSTSAVDGGEDAEKPAESSVVAASVSPSLTSADDATPEANSDVVEPALRAEEIKEEMKEGVLPVVKPTAEDVQEDAKTSAESSLSFASDAGSADVRPLSIERRVGTSSSSSSSGKASHFTPPHQPLPPHPDEAAQQGATAPRGDGAEGGKVNAAVELSESSAPTTAVSAVVAEVITATTIVEDKHGDLVTATEAALEATDPPPEQQTSFLVEFEVVPDTEDGDEEKSVMEDRQEGDAEVILLLPSATPSLERLPCAEEQAPAALTKDEKREGKEEEVVTAEAAPESSSPSLTVSSAAKAAEGAVPFSRRSVRFSFPPAHARKSADEEDNDEDGEEVPEEVLAVLREEGKREEDVAPPLRTVEAREAVGLHPASTAPDKWEEQAPVTPEKITAPSALDRLKTVTTLDHPGTDVAVSAEEYDEEEEDMVSERTAVGLIEKLNGLDALLLLKYPEYFTTGTDSTGATAAVVRRASISGLMSLPGAALLRRLEEPPAAKSRPSPEGDSPAVLVEGIASSPPPPLPITPDVRAASSSAERAEPNAATPAAAASAGVLNESFSRPASSLSIATPLAPPQLPAESLGERMRRKYGLSANTSTSQIIAPRPAPPQGRPSRWPSASSAPAAGGGLSVLICRPSAALGMSTPRSSISVRSTRRSRSLTPSPAVPAAAAASPVGRPSPRSVQTGTFISVPYSSSRGVSPPTVSAATRTPRTSGTPPPELAEPSSNTTTTTPPWIHISRPTTPPACSAERSPTKQPPRTFVVAPMPASVVTAAVAANAVASPVRNGSQEPDRPAPAASAKSPVEKPVGMNEAAGASSPLVIVRPRWPSPPTPSDTALLAQGTPAATTTATATREVVQIDGTSRPSPGSAASPLSVPTAEEVSGGSGPATAVKEGISVPSLGSNPEKRRPSNWF